MCLLKSRFQKKGGGGGWRDLKKNQKGFKGKRGEVKEGDRGPISSYASYVPPQFQAIKKKNRMLTVTGEKKNRMS